LEPVAIRVGHDLPEQFAIRGYEDGSVDLRPPGDKRCGIESTQVRAVLAKPRLATKAHTPNNVVVTLLSAY
jgi:hypothetical protein